MKVAIFHPSDELYGADRVILEVCSALSAAGVVVSVYLPVDVIYPEHSLCNALRERRISVAHVDFPALRREYVGPSGLVALGWRWLKTTKGLFAIIRRVDCVYANTSATMPLAVMGSLLRKPVLLHLHEHWGRGDARLLGLLGRLCVTKVVAVSEAVLGPLPKTLRDRSTVVYNGFPGRPKPKHPTQGPIQILMASRWNRWKGHRTLAEAWGNGIEGLALTVCGGAPASGEGIDVHGLFAGADGVCVLRELHDITCVLEKSDAVVVPSDDPDPLPTIALEALRLGIPVIGSNHGGLPEIVGTDEDGAAGWLFAPRDAAALRQVLVRLTRRECQDKGAKASARFQALFSRESFAQNIIEAVIALDE